MFAWDAPERSRQFRPVPATLSSRGQSRCLAGTLAASVRWLLALAGTLMLASAALAHAPVQRDFAPPANYVLRLPSQYVKAMAAQQSTPTTAAVFLVAAQGAAAVPWGESEDFDIDYDCCGVACHAALGNVIRPNAAQRLPRNVVLSRESPFLHGRSHGPPERPPRIVYFHRHVAPAAAKVIRSIILIR